MTPNAIPKRPSGLVAAQQSEAASIAATRRIAALERSRSFRVNLYPNDKPGRWERSAELKNMSAGRGYGLVVAEGVTLYVSI